MQKYLVVCLFAMALGVAYADVEFQPATDTPAELAGQEGCYSVKLNQVLPYNQTYTPQDGSCSQHTCRGDGQILIFTCDYITAGPGCSVVDGDLTAPFPACCESERCDDEDEFYED